MRAIYGQENTHKGQQQTTYNPRKKYNRSIGYTQFALN